MDETLDQLKELVSPALWDEAGQRFAAPHRRREWLTVRLLLSHMLGEEKRIAYLPSGKPYLADTPLHIGISHTKGFAAVILASRPVAVDIEQYGPKVCRVASRFMHSAEKAYPWKGDETWSLLLHWSAKETLFKAMDVEEVDFKEHLRIRPFLPQEEGCISACEYKTEQKRHFAVRYLLRPDFVLTYIVD
ncbi:MAG: 4'-phosphopantetheinyl transferase superfamily protein [Bacteroides sp.]|nr:4'-phosphopantetheinyl transferase superfamily protein [Bacteroides sp.]